MLEPVPRQPSGTVAFLFSDIEASTRRWERYGDSMRDAVRCHDRILRSEIERWRGYVFKTIGDAFCAAFWSASDALGAAVEVQRRLGRENFSPVDGLSVRMAIHIGEADERDGDYFGGAVNRTARLLSTGHGGQILLSGVAADLCLPHLPDGVTLRHLGALPLRDFKDPERVYQPVGLELRSDFKPLRALETPPNNLPRQTTSFVGRREDIARVEALLEESALVTIVGAGGIGKTRLAFEIAAGLLNDYRDGVWFVDLSAIGNPGLIAGTILSTLGGQRSSDADPLDDLIGHLQKCELLLVLDNSEHLVAEVAAIVAQVVARSSRVTVLATSRQPLDISTERLYRLPSLDLDSAMRLFGDRARAANPAFVLDEKAAVVEEICRRMDGIALAIELAAARVRTMSLENLVAHLELRLLAGGRDRRPRQQTMRALIDWSFDLLTEEEVRVLRRCAVFMHGFTLRMAAEVCAEEEPLLLDVLGSLVDKSLVVADARGDDQRYRLLEPIREYAWEKLAEAGELQATLSRHAIALAAFARDAYDQWDRGPATDWLSRLELELANLRAALRWCIDEANDRDLGARLAANATVIFLRLGLLDEGIESGEWLLQSGMTLPVAVEARLRYGLSMLYSNIGSYRKCLDSAASAVPLYREAEDARGLSRALSQVASRYAPQSRYDDAGPAAREALRLARDSGDHRLLADTLRRCADSFAPQGDDEVRTLYAESVTLFRRLGRNDETARALEWWGKWEEDNAGNFHEAAERFLEAMQLDRGRDAIYRAVDIAGCYLATGDAARAEPFAREALAAAAKTRHPIYVPMAISYLAIITGRRDALAAARLIGFAEERLRLAGWQRVAFEQAMIDRLCEDLKKTLSEDELTRLLEEGAAWSDDQAAAQALSA
ncbi:MAG: adenylate/guanylate cyclase domain-containing protein [Candidatus Cybelea sp.]